MNDEHDPGLDPGLDPELDPEQEARVRALLADLGTAPEAASVPPEVAARLDETLAGLVAERSAVSESTPSNVVPLRRRWASRVAAAAAAVIVVGAGGVAAANLGLFDGPTASSDSAAGGSSAGEAEALDSSTASPAPSQPGGDLPNALRATVPRLTAASFDTDVAVLVQRGQYARVPDSTVTNEGKALDRRALTDAAARGCPGPKVNDGALATLVLYDGNPAVLVIHPEKRGEQLVEAFACGGARVLDSARVPVTHDTSGQSSPGDPGLGSPTPTP
jgi:hypothetical protein